MLKVGVVGATGAVGLEMIKALEKRAFPVGELKLFASSRSAGRRLSYNNDDLVVEALSPNSARGLNLALFSAGAGISREYARIFTAAGAFVIDNSSAWRMDSDVPLVVPEVNSKALGRSSRLIANPNCSTIQMVVALKPLHDAARIKRIVVATYQSVSGAGGRAMEELRQQVTAWAQGTVIPAAKNLPQRIAFNVIPQIDVFLDNGYTKEEMKMVNETRKIFDEPDLPVSATACRVPVFRGHSEAVWIETEKKLTATEARNILSAAPGVRVVDDPQIKSYPMPVDCEGSELTYVGRIREDISHPKGLTMWIVADNLLKGAATNAVQIAEELLRRGYL